ncbi:MAG TPA: hypothetical protein VJT78_12665 [Candidatus Dormibacteraeota bacterium]|nr:hypothetical protein [Candidatus Dormibacteraeota bacterium]
MTATGPAETASSMSAAGAVAVAGTVYGPAIAEQLDAERTRAAGLESSAEAMVRSASLMLALFTAVLAFLGGSTLRPAPASLVLVGLAYLLLILAGIASTAVSIMGHRMEAYGEIPTPMLETWVAGWADAGPAAAARKVAELQISMLKDMRHGNFRKRQLTQLAVLFELLGLAALVLSLATLAVKQILLT